MADIFISYARHDADKARALVQRLQDARFTVWMDEARIEGGRDFDDEIEAGLQNARFVVVLWSVRSVASKWVRGEARWAETHGKLVPVRLDDCTLPLDLGQVHALDLRGFRRGEPHAGVDALVRQLAGSSDGGKIERDEEAAETLRRLRKRLRETSVSGLLALTTALAAVIGLSAGVPSWVPRMRLLSLYARSHAAPLSANDALRVVLIDQETRRLLRGQLLAVPPACSLQSETLAGEFGPFWRLMHARVLDRLVTAGARVVAFDMTFPEDTASAPQCASAELVSAVRNARSAGTAVFAVASAPGELGASGTEPQIERALSERAPTAGGLAHGCMGEVEGWANFVPLMFAGKNYVAALSLASVAAWEGASLIWDPGTHRMLLAAEGRRTRAVPYTGLGEPPAGVDVECAVAQAGERPALRVLDPFPKELRRQDARVIPYEQVLLREGWQGRIRDKLVLLGVLDRSADRHRTCDGQGCRSIGGISLHAAAIDVLNRSDAIQVISTALQLTWIAAMCLCVGLLRFASAKRSAWRRFGELSGLVVLDVLVSVYLAVVLGTLVDTLHHVLAMGVTYALVAWIEPARVHATR